MKTFEQWLETRPSWEQPKNDDERLKMHIAFSGGQLDASDEYHQSLIRATSHICGVLQ